MAAASANARGLVSVAGDPAGVGGQVQGLDAAAGAEVERGVHRARGSPRGPARRTRRRPRARGRGAPGRAACPSPGPTPPGNRRRRRRAVGCPARPGTRRRPVPARRCATAAPDAGRGKRGAHRARRLGGAEQEQPDAGGQRRAVGGGPQRAARTRRDRALGGRARRAGPGRCRRCIRRPAGRRRAGRGVRDPPQPVRVAERASRSATAVPVMPQGTPVAQRQQLSSTVALQRGRRPSRSPARRRRRDADSVDRRHQSAASVTGELRHRSAESAAVRGWSPATRFHGQASPVSARTGSRPDPRVQLAARSGSARAVAGARRASEARRSRSGLDGARRIVGQVRRAMRREGRSRGAADDAASPLALHPPRRRGKDVDSQPACAPAGLFAVMT